MIYTKTITLNSFVDQKGYLRETDFPFFLRINRFMTTDSYSGYSKQFYVVRNDENRESLRKVELLRWLLCDDLFFLVFSQCFELNGKLKTSIIDGFESNVYYTQIMSPILNKSKRRPTTVNLLKKVSEYIINNPSVLQIQMEHLKSNIEESEFFSSIYAADKTYYDYLVMEKAIVQGKLLETEQTNAVLHTLKRNYEENYHSNNNLVKTTLCKSIGWDIPTNNSADLAFLRQFAVLVIESITEENPELQHILQKFANSDQPIAKNGYNRFDYEKPFTELHNTVQQALSYTGELFRVSNGFLTLPFYKYALNHAKNRLYFVSPSNENLITPETFKDFETMIQRAKNGLLDFKCIYSSPDKTNKFLDLDPDPDSLRQQIKTNFEDAKNYLESMEMEPHEHIRSYPGVYSELMVVVDDVLLYVRPFENNIFFTNAVNQPFYVLHANSKGAFMAIEDFNFCWAISDNSTNIKKTKNLR